MLLQTNYSVKQRNNMLKILDSILLQKKKKIHIENERKNQKEPERKRR